MKHQYLLPLLLLISGPAWSAPTVSMSWDNCTGPINQANTGPHKYSLYVSVVGIDRAHKAFEVWGAYGTAENTTPDAWMYDILNYGELAVPPAVSVTPEVELSKVCPALDGGLPGLFISGVRPHNANDTEVPPGTMVFMVANAYADNLEVDPNQRYFVARIDFDHSTSVEGEGIPGVSRGGFEQAIWFRAQADRCRLLGLDGIEYPMESGNGAVLATFGGSPDLTPAAATTWGQIKSQYRR
jgi:hypothetical protein